MSKIQKFFFNLNKIPLYLLIFLFPLWFLPLGEDEVNLSKQILATFLVSISLVGFFGRKIFERDLSFKTHKVFWIFLGLFFPSIFSFFNFPYFWTSFFGNPKEIGDSIFSLILYFLATFLYFQSFEKKEIPLLLFWFLFSSGIVLILALLSQFKIYLLPFDFAKTPFFTLVGILPQFCVFLALFLPLFYLFSVKTKSFFRLFFFLFFFVALFDLFLAGSRLAWFLVGIESLFLFLLTFKPNFQNYGVSFGYLILFSLSLFFYFFPLFQKEILTFDTLPYSFETLFARQIFSFPWRQKILGTGPASFLFTFAKFKPAILNQTIFWPTRFSRGASFFLDWFVTRGIFGAVLFLVSFFFLFQFLLKKIFSGTFSEKNFLETKTLGTILFSFSLCFFIFNPNFSLQFLFFSFLGLFLLFAEPKIKIFSQVPLSHFGFNLLFLISFLFFSFSFYFQGTKLFSEIFYYLAKESRDPQSAVKFLSLATKIHPQNASFWRDLSQAQLSRAREILLRGSFKKEDLDNLILNSILAINKAIKLSPFDPSNWNVRGFIFRQLVGLDEKATDLALQSYQKAIELEPHSPYAWTEKGRVYILSAQNYQAQGNLEKQKEFLNAAVSVLEHSLSIQKNYSQTYYLLAVAKDQLGDREGAISALEKAREVVPEDWVSAFQLGILYSREGYVEKAKEMGEIALQLNPKEKNIHLFLASLYDKLKERDKAILEIENLSKEFPENEAYQKMLENLKSGKPIFEGIEKEKLPIFAF